MNRFSRRDFLARVGASAATLPLLAADPARAAGATPRRFIALYWPNGVIPKRFWPSASAVETPLSAMTLPDTLAPLEKWKNKINILGGLKVQNQPGSGTGYDAWGHACLYALLTGAKNTATAGPVANNWYQHASAPSLDVVVAQALATRFGVGQRNGLTLAVQPRNDGNYKMSWLGRDQENTVQKDPYAVFDQLFKGPAADPAAPGTDKLRATRKSVLDYVARDIQKFRVRLGAEDRMAIDQHAQAIRDLESALVPSAQLASCSKDPRNTLGTPAGTVDGSPVILRDGRVDSADNSNFPVVMKAQIDLIVLAFKCDIARTATLMVTDKTGDGLLATWLGAPAGGGKDPVLGSSRYAHHAVSHHGSDNPGTPDEDLKVKYDQYYYSKVAYLLGQLDAIREPGGNGESMLDNTVVLCTSSQSTGGDHYCHGVPWIMAGSGGGKLKTGRYFKWGNWDVRAAKNQNNPGMGLKPDGEFIPHNRVLTSIHNVLLEGVAPPIVDGFGDPTTGGEASGLRVGT